MMNEVLSRPGSMGSDGLKWWIGRVAPRSAWVGGGTLVNDKDVGVDSANPEIDIYYNRVKVSVVGYHDRITNPVDLPWDLTSWQLLCCQWDMVSKMQLIT